MRDDAPRFGCVGLGNLGGPMATRDPLAPFADLAQKDLAHAIEHARSLGLDLPGAARCRDPMWDVCRIGSDSPKGDDGGNDD